MRNPNIVFFGNERLATGVTTSAPALSALVSTGYNVSAIVSSFEKAQSREGRDLEIAEVAKKYGIPVLLPSKLLDIKEQIESYGATIGVLVAYGRIVPQAIIDIFPKGIVNIHPSLLPLHRGPTPVESTILDGEPKTGVSIMSLVRAMDAGPIYGQSELALNGNESKQELADRLLEIGSLMITELLPDIINDNIIPLPQDDSRATYDALLAKQDGVIDWHKPAEQLEREIRAYMEWPKNRTTLGGKEVVLIQAHVSEASGKPGEVKIVNNQLMVACGKNALAIDRLKPAGKQEMTAAEFLRGYGSAL